MSEPNTKLIIHAKTQTAELFINEKPFKTYTISTAAKGLGCEENSNKTPTGLLSVSKKFGLAALPGTIFKSRQPTGAFWSIDQNNHLRDSEEDLILTRILWLEGLEDHNTNTKSRYIYIHGTNREDLLGTPASHGCIRMSNKDIVELFDLMPEGAHVEVRP